MSKENDSPAVVDETNVVSPQPTEDVVNKKEEIEKKKEGEGTDEENSSKNQEPEIYSQIGNHTFKTKEELEEFAKKEYGEHSRLIGEVNRKAVVEGADVVKPAPRAEETNEVKPENNSLRRVLQYKADIFFFDNPEAEPYRDLIASILQTGKAVNEKGLPDFGRAWEKAQFIINGVQENKEQAPVNKAALKTGGSTTSGVGVTKENNKPTSPANAPFLKNIWRSKGV